MRKDSKILSSILEWKKDTPVPTREDFIGVASRITGDWSSSIYQESCESFWNEIISQASSLGFTFREEKIDSNHQNDDSMPTVASFYDDGFQSDNGKVHIAATKALLGISTAKATKLSIDVLDSWKEEYIRNDSRISAAEAANVASQLIGSKAFLKMVQDYHYKEQEARIKLITESLHLECADDIQGKNQSLQTHCVEFLNLLDQRYVWSPGMPDVGKGRSRGLFRFLLFIACAPLKVLGHEQLYRSVELQETENPRSNSTHMLDGSVHYFVRDLMDAHNIHHDNYMRSAALDALFMLLYVRIDGGIGRTDYVLLLQAFACHDFFSNSSACTDTASMKKQRHLVALIGSECASLWRTSAPAKQDDESPWIDSHPLLIVSENAFREIEVIGTKILPTLANRMIHRQNASDGAFDTPESLLILTFGLLLKLASKKCDTETHFLCSDIVKDIADKCVNMANDTYGSFEYLVSIAAACAEKDAPLVVKPFMMYTRDLTEIMDRKLLNSNLLLTNGIGDVPEDNMFISKASIIREVLIATISAFQSSLNVPLQETVPLSLVQNLNIFCIIASLTHNNSKQLCERFWDDKNQYQKENIDYFTNDSRSSQLIFLLYASSSLASTVISHLHKQRNGSSSIATDYGSDEAEIILYICPLLTLVSSLIYQGCEVFAVVKDNISKEIVRSSLLGCLSIAMNPISKTREHYGDIEWKSILDATYQVVKSLGNISQIAKLCNDNETLNWMMSALASESGFRGCGPSVIFAACLKMLKHECYDADTTQDITSGLLCIISNLAFDVGYGNRWTLEAGEALSTMKDTDIQYFVCGVSKVTDTFSSLLIQIVSQLPSCSLTKDSNDDSIGAIFTATEACVSIASGILCDFPKVLVLSTLHRRTLSNAIFTLQTCLTVANGLSIAPKHTKVQEYAKSLRKFTLNSLSTSTGLGITLGFYATLPVTLRLSEWIQMKNIITFSNEYSEEKKIEPEEKDHSHLLNFKVNHENNSSNASLIEIAKSAVRLMLVWNDSANTLALKNTRAAFNDNLEDYFSRETIEEKREIVTKIISYGPSRLLTSAVVRPLSTDEVPVKFWPGSTIPMLSLLTVYTRWAVESDIDIWLGSAVLNLISSYIQNMFYMQSLLHFDSMPIPLLGAEHIRNICSQYRYVITKFPGGHSHRDRIHLPLILSMLKMLEVSASHEPAIASLILCDTGEHIFDFFFDLIDTQEMINSLPSCLLSSSCLRFFAALSRSSQKNGFEYDIISTLNESDILVKTCKNIVQNTTFTDHLNPTPQQEFHKCVLLSAFTNALEIIHSRTDLSSDSKSFLETQDFLRSVTPDTWLRSLASACVRHRNIDFYEVLQTHSDSFTDQFCRNALRDPSSAMVLIDCLTGGNWTDVHESFFLLTLSIESLAASAITATAIATFVHNTLPLSLFHEADILSQALHLFESMARGMLIAFSKHSNGDDTSVFHHSLRSAISILDLILILSCDSNCEILRITSVEPLIRSSEIYLSVSGKTDKNSLYNDEICVATLTYALNVSNNFVRFADSTRHCSLFNDVATHICRFATNALSSLRKSDMIRSRIDVYRDFESNSEYSNRFKLLELIIALITTLGTPPHFASLDDKSFYSQTYFDRLTSIFSQTNLFNSLAEYFENASYHLSQNTSSRTANDTIKAILTCATLYCNCPGSGPAELLLESRLIHVIIQNESLVKSCEKWESDGNSMIKVRGYFELSNAIHTATSEGTTTLILDPSHDIWCKTVRMLSSLLRQAMNVFSQVYIERTATLVIDFLSFYQAPIISFLERHLTQNLDAKGVHTISSPSSGFGFTISTLNEMKEILLFICELCTPKVAKLLESRNVNIYTSFTAISTSVLRSFSSFMGSLSISRELFSALKSLNDVIEQDLDETKTALEFEKYSKHPLLVDGIPNAKHHAIRNSIFCGSFCTPKSQEEILLSRSPAFQDDDDSSTLESSFYGHINNSFTIAVENLSSQCVFYALRIIQKLHPASSAFMTFSADEANHLKNSRSICLETGTLVAFRSDALNPHHLFSESDDMCYGRVMNYNHIARTFDVECESSTDGKSQQIERNVCISRIATVEDISKRQALFDYRHAPESVADVPHSFNGTASIGNLILILRWCREHASSSCSRGRASGSVSDFLVQSIAEASITVLGEEMAIHLELNSPALASVVESAKIPRQILDLFDDEEALPNLYPSSPSAKKSKAALSSIVGEEAWSQVKHQCDPFLSLARLQRDAESLSAERSDSLNWSSTPRNKGSRRSPFH